MGMDSEEVPEGRIIGRDTEGGGEHLEGSEKTQTTICDEHKAQYFNSGYEAGKKDGYDEGYAAGRRWQAPRSFEGGRELGRAQLLVERKEWFKANVLEKRWAIDPETGGVVMTPELFGQMKTALSTAWLSFERRMKACLELSDLMKSDGLTEDERRVVEYMRNSFSSATIDGVIRAMRGEKQ